MKNHLHIVSFNIPYPPDYGGVMEVFNKIIALKEQGIEVTLHCFAYGRKESEELDRLCKKVYYYKRKTGLLSQFSYIPYIIFSRRSPELLKNLQADNDPVFFEGLHTTYYLCHKILDKRTKIVRTHNIEHRYYWNLFLSEKSLRKKIFFIGESVKLYIAQSKLKYADSIAAISINDYQYFQKRFKRVFLLNAFHSANRVESSIGRGKYLLFHGNLSVPENIKAFYYLAEHVFSRLNFPVIIAGKDPVTGIKDKISEYTNLELVASPSEIEMKKLIKEAQIIILFSFQGTGAKLKLLESLFYGRFCIINSKITEDKLLASLCENAEGSSQFLSAINNLFPRQFEPADKEFRNRALEPYKNAVGVRLIKTMIEN